MAKPKSFSPEKALQELLCQPVTDEKEIKRAAALGLDLKKLCNGSLLLIGLFESAKGGNTSALKELLSILERGQVTESGVKIVDDV